MPSKAGDSLLGIQEELPYFIRFLGWIILFSQEIDPQHIVVAENCLWYIYIAVIFGHGCLYLHRTYFDLFLHVYKQAQHLCTIFLILF